MMNKSSEYIYVLNNKIFEENYVNIGATRDYENKLLSYREYFPYPCVFEKLYEIKDSKYSCFEIYTKIKYYFEEYQNKVYGGSTDYFKIDVINQLDAFFNDNNIKFEIINSNDQLIVTDDQLIVTDENKKISKYFKIDYKIDCKTKDSYEIIEQEKADKL